MCSGTKSLCLKLFSINYSLSDIKQFEDFQLSTSKMKSGRKGCVCMTKISADNGRKLPYDFS